MIIGPKYKICKRLGGAVFEQCQSERFVLAEARATQARTRGRRPAAMSEYKRQLLEKQKMRYTYGLSERQLSRYVAESIEKSGKPSHALILRLESRLDNVVYRLGLAKTRRMARQMVSHGHIMVDGKKVRVPSYLVKKDQVISVREGSKSAGLFEGREEEITTTNTPAWMTFDMKKLTGSLTGAPTYELTELLFDPEQVLEYYSR